MADEHGWKILLRKVLPILQASPAYEWSLGGGTALYLSLSHRLSKDIDLFFTNANALREFAPSRNAAVRAICDTHQQPGHFIKLEIRGQGEIDFLVTREFHDEPTFDYLFDGQTIRVETPAEIVSKKLYFRASAFTIRDIFDLAACAVKIEGFAGDIHPDVSGKAALAIDIIKRRALEYRKRIAEEIVPLEIETAVLQDGPDLAVSLLEAFLSLHAEKELPGPSPA